MSAVAYATAQPTPADAPATPGIALTTQLAGQSALLPAGVLALLVSLHRAVEPERQRRLQARQARQAFFDGGGLPDFRTDTAGIRADDWTVAAIPDALQDRRVEITGPTDPKMVINALNSGAKVFMADFEDSTAPAWRNLLAGQQALIGAVRGDLTHTAPNGKQYALRPLIEQAVLIETLPAVFEMDEILHALRDRIVGLNCGRWDYIFSYIKTFRRHRDKVLPERGQVTMTQPFLKAYSELLIKTCHRRGAHAMGGMAAQIPINHDPAANEQAMARVRADKLREVSAGHDGTWVAHPALIPVAQAIFDAHMPGPNQHQVLRRDVQVDRDALIAPPTGTITRAGFEGNVDVCVRYLAAWLDGNGCVPIHHLMEDAATAEISRSQLWQWLHTGGQHLDDGTAIDLALLDAALAQLPARLGDRSALPGATRIEEAIALLADLSRRDELTDFLTLPAYDRLD